MEFATSVRKQGFKKPFCKVCYDAGKPLEIYTSHYVKSQPGFRGKVVCPTLLNQPCSFCGRKGHTVSHCSAIAKNKRNSDRKDRVQRYMKDSDLDKSKSSETIVSNNIFKDLEMDSEDEMVQTSSPKQLLKPRLTRQTNIQWDMSFAEVVSSNLVAPALPTPGKGIKPTPNTEPIFVQRSFSQSTDSCEWDFCRPASPDFPPPEWPDSPASYSPNDPPLDDDYFEAIETVKNRSWNDMMDDDSDDELDANV